MAPNPNPSRVTDAQWWLWERLHELEQSTELGGFYAFKSGYHSTRRDNQANWSDDYSIQDATDKAGPADKAAAIDWTFPEAQRGDYRRISKYTRRLVVSADDANDPRLNNWREFYGTTDGQNVTGRDTRYGSVVSSDDSHLWHIHGSESREYVGDLDNKKAFLSVLKGETVEQWRAGTGDDVVNSDEIARLASNADASSLALVTLAPVKTLKGGDGKTFPPITNRLAEELAAIRADIKKVATCGVDVAALVEALRPAIGAAVATELAERLKA